MNFRLNSSNEMDINLNSSNSFIVMTVLPDEQWKLDIVSIFFTLELNPLSSDGN